jgi:hypothetical protein
MSVAQPDLTELSEYDPDLDDLEGTLRFRYASMAEEAARQARIAAGVEHACVLCGCSESLPCPGGCIWARPNLCSRCAVLA